MTVDVTLAATIDDKLRRSSVTPYLVIDGVPTLIDFLTSVFGATELLRHVRPDGSVQHAEVLIGHSKIMMGEPHAGGRAMPTTLYVDVGDGDVDDVYARAVAAGGRSLREPADQPQGGRMAGVEDAAGNHWYIASAQVAATSLGVANASATKLGQWVEQGSLPMDDAKGGR